MSQNYQRLPFIDALKAVASQLIILHHLAFYGPMSDVAFSLAPDLFVWLSRYGRVAVQVFLVVSGFLAARSLASTGESRLHQPVLHIWRRYVRLVAPYAMALVMAMLCAALARLWMTHDSIPDSPTVWQVIAHLLLLQNVLNIDALSAGVWYVAIDFQLFAVMVLVLWLCQRLNAGRHSLGWLLGVMCMMALGLSSLFFFNRSADWDDLFLYFCAAYVIGAASYWISIAPTSARVWCGFVALAAIVALAQTIDFRLRIAVAFYTALALGVAQRTGWLRRWPHSRVLGYLGKISYSVFLIHFPVCLVVNAIFSHWAPTSPWLNAMGILLAWTGSLVCGALLFHQVENRIRWKKIAGAA